MKAAQSSPSARQAAVLFLLAGVGLATAPAQASLVTNGSFESPAIAAASFLNIVGGAEPVGFGWTVTVNNVDIFSNGVLSTTGLVYEGTQALDLVGFGSSGGIRQAFATTAGTTYRLRFAYGNNPISTGGASAAVLVADGATALLSDSVSHTTSTVSDLAWDLYEGQFVGTGGTVTLSFTNLTGGSNGGVFLDAVTVDEVVVTPALPLPATPALVGLGLWAAAAARRRPPR